MAKRGGQAAKPAAKPAAKSAARAAAKPAAKTAAKPTKQPTRKPTARSAPRGRTGPRRCWLVKSEPTSYSIHDLERDGVTGWDGVRNYQARNTLRDEMRPGDPVLVYHSNADPMAIVGLARVAGPARPDPTAFDPRDHHFDPDSRREDPTWFLVDLAHVETFAVPLQRATLAARPDLAGMMLLRKGSRLSVQPVTDEEFEAVLELERALARAAGKGAAPLLAPARRGKDTGRRSPRPRHGESS